MKCFPYYTFGASHSIPRAFWYSIPMGKFPPVFFDQTPYAGVALSYSRHAAAAFATV